MFNFFKKQKIKSLPNTKNIAFGFSKVPIVNNLLKTQNFQEIGNIYATLKNDEKSMLLEGAALNRTTVNDILKWHNQQPEDWLANLFAGVGYTFIAWEERSGQFAKYLSEGQITGFLGNLEKARECLNKARLLNPKEAEIYSRLIRLNMGLSQKSAAQDCFEKLCALDPTHLDGHIFMLNLLTPKWLGSEEEMKELALQFKNPAKNDLRYVIFLRYVVEYFFNLSYSNVPNPERIVKQEFETTIRATYAQFDIPKIPSLHRYLLHNYFSFLFYMFGDRSMRNKEIDLIGKNLTYIPWAYCGVDGQRDLLMMKFK